MRLKDVTPSAGFVRDWTMVTAFIVSAVGCGSDDIGMMAVVSAAQNAENPLPVSGVTASAHDGNVPTNTLDGSLSTRWSAKGDGEWIQYDLGGSRTISSVSIAWYKGDQRRARFKIRVGSSPSSLTTVYSGESSGSALNLENYAFSSLQGRYVRIVGYGNTINSWNSITEVEIYETANPDPGENPYPANILDLSYWKLTLPIGSNNAIEIKQPQLATYRHGEYFDATGAGDGVRFKAHCGGTTTSGSKYPRSELREMEPGYSGSNPKASWSTTSGTHTMFIRQAVTHLPAVKRHIVVGQVHDSSDDVVVFRLEGSKLFIEEDGQDGPVLTRNYTLGTVFTVKFVAHDGGIDCYYNGDFIHRREIRTSGCYFKAGAYTQSNTSKGDAPSAYGEVVIYDLWVSHT